MSQPAIFQLTEADQQFLLQIARSSIGSYLAGEHPHLPEIPTGALTESRGIFVSLHQGTELRGCIGNIHAVSPLYRSAAECAIAAAVGDPRFMPMMASDLPTIDIEISVLSPLETVHDIREIEIGKHGLLVSHKGARGLLLPQVATTYGWDRERFLQETCRKAGLKPDDWKQGVTIQSFCAVVFSEKQFHFEPYRAADDAAKIS
jgi:AmmeMemoRadiSam system protein A